jgi:2-polyprenyl-6-methoxyphenol hydroxylase-like FAD-dependent oxidoreductase
LPHTIEVPVLVVGGSLVGMSSAMLLGHYGVRSLVVEHHRGTAIHPRAAQISQRTMEIFRTVGVEQIVRRNSADQFVQDGAIMAVETLAGKEVAYYIANLNEGIRDLSPCERVFISQSLLEPLLKQRAEELGADLRFATEMTSFEQDVEGVTAQIRHRDSGETATVRARYMIAADGAHSRVRERLGIRMLGRGVFSNSITIYFRANLGPLLRGRKLSVIYVINPILRGFFRIEIPFDSGFLAITAVGDPEHPNTNVSDGLTEQRCLELLHAALGVDDIPVTIEDVMYWQSAADTAERFREQNIFLAGDSAHVMPPHGGFGGNTGVQDAQNLAWKLAWVLKGAAAPDLLDTYDQERRPVCEFTVEQAYSRYVTRTAPYLASKGFQPVAHDMNVELGYCYESNGHDGPLHEHPRESKGRPGTRAPHAWLSENCSTLDLFGHDFLLLAGPDWSGTTHLKVHGLTKPEVLSAYGITSKEAALIRPDGFVEWREGCP